MKKGPTYGFHQGGVDDKAKKKGVGVNKGQKEKANGGKRNREGE